jgi:Tol biopolymer transport system component/DNA-binding winged helix-turn-helix (wHTH) protein
MSLQTRTLTQFGPFRLDPAERLLTRGGQPVALPPRAFDLLVVLVTNAGHLLTKEELLRNVWGDTFVEEGNLPYTVSLLRKAMRDDAEPYRYIETVPKRGYRFMEPVALIATGNDEGADTASRDSHHVRSWLVLAAGLCVTALAVVVLFASRFARTELQPTVRPLTTYPGIEADPAISAEGTEVAFRWNRIPETDSGIYVKQIGPGEPIRLTNSPAREFSPKWSPDGQWIAFLRLRPEPLPRRFDVYRVPAHGGAEQKLGEASRIALEWSPDGRSLVITKELALVRLWIDTETTTLLTSPVGSEFDADARIAPDAQRMAFQRLSPSGAAKLLVAGLSETFRYPGPTLMEIKLPAKTGPVTYTWSADGRDIVYSSGLHPSSSTLWRVSVSGAAQPRQLSFTGEGALTPSISRRGERMVFSRWFREHNILALNLDQKNGTTNSTTREFDSSRSERNPRFAPDGLRVALESNRSGSDEIWICDTARRGCDQLTNLANPPDPSWPVAWRVGNPAWSPDGNAIAFDASERNGGSAVYVVRVSGGKPTRVTDGYIPRWSRDGQWIYYADRPSSSDGSSLFRISVTRKTRLQLNLTGGTVTSLEESPDGQSVYYSDGDQLFTVPASRKGPKIAALPSSERSVHSFVVLPEGIFYLQTKDDQTSLRWYDTTKKAVQILYQTTMPIPVGLTIAPNGRRIFFSQIDRVEADLMLVDHFR